ncbi:MAG: amidohydrolase [archaeon GBS-70-058]|nr:amidohydrolase [Candidatus Culexarchaeum nevadense]
MNIDVHSHFYPSQYIEELKRGGGYAYIEFNEYGSMIIKYEGDYNVVVKPHIDVLERIKVMDKYGIDMQILTLTTPGVEREPVDRGVKLAKIVNDSFSEIVERYPDRFRALAILPLQSPDIAVEEFRRAILDLGLNGAIIFSNINGKPLDSKDFWPLYSEAEKLGFPLFIHPTSPVNLKFMEDYRIVPMFGFPVDTSLAVLRLILSGVIEKFPSLKIVVAHLGGVLPYIIGRIDTCVQAYPEAKKVIGKPASAYLKNMYFDSICYNNDILRFSCDFLGADKIMLGTDFPHQITDIENAVWRVKQLGIGELEERMILGDNAIKVFKIN